MRIVIGLAAAVCLMLATAANAQPYVGLQGGLNLAFDSEIEQFGTTGDQSYYPGGALSVHFGYGFPFGLRLEGELAFRSNETDDIEGTDLDGTVASGALMANVFYDFYTGTGVEPYIGVGIGAATVVFDDFRIGGFKVVDDSDTAFAFQFGGGVAYWFTPNVAMTGDLRFFGTSELDMTDEGGNDFTATYFNASLMVGARFSF